mmetsp:Transcript_29047/g.60323  ORF Transcript_29047/g.60323 Transcript_29047/m.60323 type:complete len:284 (+) Transcript_29047:202-1053(+)
MTNDGEAQPAAPHDAPIGPAPPIVAEAVSIVSDAVQHNPAPEIVQQQHKAPIVQPIDETKQTTPDRDDGDQYQEEDDNGARPSKKRKTLKKSRILAPREAMEKYWHRGIYVENGDISCRCNNKPCNKYDTYQYERHFTFKVHRKYEAEDADETFHRSTMVAFLQAEAEKGVAEVIDPNAPPLLPPAIASFQNATIDICKSRTADNARSQEEHWMKMWCMTRAELKKARDELKTETNPELVAELEIDISGLKKRKDELSKSLGFTKVTKEESIKFEHKESSIEI